MATRAHVASLALALALSSGCKTESPPVSTPDPARRPAPSAVETSTVKPSPKTVAPAKPGSADSLKAVARGDREFASSLYQRLGTQPGNLFFSPTSIRVALGMAFAGAAGDTKAEMAKTLSLDDTAAEGFSALLADWAARANIEPRSKEDWARATAERQRLVLRVVNRLWGQTGKSFQPAFLGVLSDRYAAPLEQLDFRADTEPSRLRINAWVEDQTEKRIKDLLAPGAVNSATSLVLTNAVYFKATWAEEFGQASPGDFYPTPSSPVKVPMMQLEHHLPLAVVEIGGVKAKALVLPYQSPGVAMIALVPDARDGLAKLEAGLTAAVLDKVIATDSYAKVAVTMPKFKMTSSFGLGPTLAAMGMPTAFLSGKADFSGMDGTHELFIGSVVHKAFVAVDEKGTEAAAATAVAMAGAGAPRPEPIVPVVMDHPFAFAIVDTNQKVVLFMGRVADPR